MNCVLFHEGKILLLQRSGNVGFYPGWWNGVAGFLDDERTLEEKVRDEVREETGIEEDNIVSIEYGTFFLHDEPRYGKTWIIFPVLVRVVSDTIKVDWESERFEWIEPRAVEKYRVISSFKQVLEALGFQIAKTTRYDKLVRDRIPEIIQAKGEPVKSRVASEKEYWKKLKEKLFEEVREFDRDESIEELADIYEVIRAIEAYKGFSRKECERVREEKARRKGAFKNRIILEES